MKYQLKLILIGTLLSTVVGCSTTSPNSGVPNVQSLAQATQSFQDFLDKVQTVTITDIDTALADIHSHGDNDLAALQCLPAVKAFVQNNVAFTKPVVKGVFSANQLKRDVVLGGVNNNAFQMQIRALHTACAAYVGDEARFAAEFAVMIGAASHGVPPAANLPGAIGGAIQPLLPIK
jgi:hypothetical protein